MQIHDVSDSDPIPENFSYWNKSGISKVVQKGLQELMEGPRYEAVSQR